MNKIIIVLALFIATQSTVSAAPKLSPGAIICINYKSIIKADILERSNNPMMWTVMPRDCEQIPVGMSVKVIGELGQYAQMYAEGYDDAGRFNVVRPWTAQRNLTYAGSGGGARVTIVPADDSNEKGKTAKADRDRKKSTKNAGPKPMKRGMARKEVKKTPTTKFMRVNAPSGLIVRKSPGLKSERIGKLDNHTKVNIIRKSGKTLTIDDIQGEWVRVRSGITVGYVFDGYLIKDKRAANTSGAKVYMREVLVRAPGSAK